MIRLLCSKTGGALYFPNFLAEEDANSVFNTLAQKLNFETKYMNFQGSLVGLPRKLAYFGEKPYTYSGITHEAKPFFPLLTSLHKLIIHVDTKNIVTSKSLEKLNSCLINLYENENDKIHFHADDEKELGPDNEKNILVASLTVGEEREFVIRTKVLLQKQLGEENTDNIELKLGLKHGSLLIMYGDFQHQYEHGILKAKTRKEPRINMTYRVIND